MTHFSLSNTGAACCQAGAKVVFTFVLVSQLFACSTLGVSDSSLDHKNPPVLPPLDMAGESTQMLRPLFPLPAYQADDQTKGKAASFTNEQGNRFEMPRPTTQAALDKGSVAMTASKAASLNTFNKALTENERGVPILQVQASQSATRDKIIDILTSANYKAIKPSSGNHIIIASDGFSGNRLLRLSSLGTVTTVMVTNPDNTLAETSEARFILDAINKRW